MSEKKYKKVTYASAVHGDEEKQAIVELLDNRQTILGKHTETFEKDIAETFGKKHGIMVNSGTSANYLAVKLMNLPEGAEVITPILTFTSCVAPIVQNNLVPVFVDAKIENYQIDIEKIEDAISEKTKAMLVPNLLGNVPDLEALKNTAEKHNLIFIEDSCDTLGATYNGKPTGVYSDISTTSFYGSHIITAAGGGGMLCVDQEDWAKRAKVLRGWGRSSAADETESVEERFKQTLEDIPFDSKFIFIEPAHNFLPMEISAAFGVEQLKKLESFKKKRQEHFVELYSFFSEYKDIFILPERDERIDTAWIAFPLTISKDAGFSRLDIVTYLEEAGIQTRPLFSGNILRHPAYKHIARRTPFKEYPVADYVMEFSFVLGCHHGLTSDQLEHIKNVIRDFLKNYA